ncbi:hypothetical protein F4802DRAFT_544171 [Xylaria palmicola]|nr:hypothetical protein F4802DRAFT_544171 [Xylaria palmicola]
MPIAIIGEIIEGAILGSAIGGSVGGYCASHPGVAGCIQKRDILYNGDVPHMRVQRQADVGPCNVPQYNFDQCRDQLAGTHVDSSTPNLGGEFTNPVFTNYQRVLTKVIQKLDSTVYLRHA